MKDQGKTKFNPVKVDKNEIADPVEYQRKVIESITSNSDQFSKYINSDRPPAAVQRVSNLCTSYINANADFQSYKHLKKRDILQIQQLEESNRIAVEQDEFLRTKVEKQIILDKKTEQNRKKRLKKKLRKENNAST